MRVPLSWLGEFVGIDLPVNELVEVMGRNGLEIEDVRAPGARVDGVRVARVLDVSDHPQADRLVVVTIHDGAGERTVCAGARNITAGDHVPYAPPGARLPHLGRRGETIEIGRREMRGVTSDGMLCSPRELEIGDDHSGIMVLDEAVEPGEDLVEVFPLGDPVLDVAVPADRGDLQSIFGIARDLAAILDVEVDVPPDPRESESVQGELGDVPVRVEALDGCSRYVGWVVEGLSAGPSPWWLRRRLELCGIRSLSNLVDITNYVMLERGQPLHAFDLELLRGPAITVRWAEPGEGLRTLDGRDRHLEEGDLVIADAQRAVALAGVMGGEETEVTDGTTRILLEAAAFAPAAVRRTSRRLGLVSEASMRFERRVDPAGCLDAAGRAVQLLSELAAGADAGVRVSGSGEETAPPIVLDTAWCARFLGLPELDTEAQARLLERAGVEVRADAAGGGTLEAVPPTWRGDLVRPADLAEEVARLHGYERIPATLPEITLRGGLTARQRAERDVRAALLAHGHHEAQTNPFVAEDAVTLLAPDDEGRVALENPLAKDSGYMRPGLAEGLLGAARRNAGQGRSGLALFEIARVFRAPGGPLDRLLDDAGVGLWTGPDGEVLPTQPTVLGLVAYGDRGGHGWVDRQAAWDLFDLLAAVDEVARVLDAGPLERRPVERRPLHAGRSAALMLDGVEVGIAGQLDPREADRRDLPTATVVAEVVLDLLWAGIDGERPVRRAEPIVRHPAVSVDVAVVVAETVSHGEVRAAVRGGAGDLLEDLRLFDVYRGEQVGEKRKSLAFHLRLQSSERQLTDEDAEAAIARVEAEVAKIGGVLRR